jgi:hypothetical protein
MPATVVPNPNMMFLSWKGGAQGSAPPRRDDFREVFQGRLAARLSARNQAVKASESARRSKSSQTAGRRQAREKVPASQTTSGSDEAQKTAGVKEDNRPEETRRTRRRAESQVATAGLAEDKSQSVSSPRPAQPEAAAASMPQALQDLIAFLQSQPDGTLKISAQQIPAAADYLVSAGLPSEEVERLLASPDFAAKGLSAADLQAAWQRTQTQAQKPAGETVAESSTGSKSSEAGLNLSPEVQKLLQDPDYKARWERLTLPANMLPTLRLALARLGATPEALAQLEDDTQGKGIPLSRVWQVLKGGQSKGSLPVAEASSTPSSGENFSAAALQEDQPVSLEEMSAWRQILLKAGLEPEEVEKLLGQESPGSQEDLKTTLLALAPPDEQASVLSGPKPLYLPQNLRLSPFFWQGQAHGEQSQLSGNGSENQQYAAADLAAANGEALGVPAFAAELLTFNPNVAGTGAPLSSTSPAWHSFAPEVRAALWSQLQSGIISNLQPGESQVSLKLNPPDLGQIQLTLNLSGQELAVTAVASRPEVAEMATQGVQQLLQALAQQGLVLTHFQVRLQEQPGVQTSSLLAGNREKNSESGEKFPPPSRRRSSEVDRFV